MSCLRVNAAFVSICARFVPRYRGEARSMPLRVECYPGFDTSYPRFCRTIRAAASCSAGTRCLVAPRRRRAILVTMWISGSRRTSAAGASAGRRRVAAGTVGPVAPGRGRDRRWRGGRTANAPVLKTGVRKDMRVRIPPPPLDWRHQLPHTRVRTEGRRCEFGEDEGATGSHPVRFSQGAASIAGVHMTRKL